MHQLMPFLLVQVDIKEFNDRNMALTTFTGQLTQPTSTNASFGVTGVGFTPKVILFFANDQTADGSAIHLATYLGMATSSSNRTGMSMIAVTASTDDRYQSGSTCLIITNITETILVKADLVSLDSDGFTLNFSTVDSTARKINYMCLGGADLTNANIVNMDSVTGPSQAVTGMGFKPDTLIIFSPTFGTTDPGGDGGGGGGASTCMGFVTSTTQSVAYGSDAQSCVQKSGGIVITRPNGNAGTIRFECTLTSFDSDGFTVNWGTASSGRRFYCLGLKGGQYKAGVFNQNTSNGNQAITGVGFKPTGIMMLSQNAAATTSIQTNARRLSIGAGSDSTHRKSTWTGTDATNWNENLDSSNLIKTYTPGALGSPTLNSAADLVSFDSDGFTINDSTTDATSREIGYIIFGSAATTKHFLASMGVGS